jgi:large subunit ribosomal protein L17
MRHLNTKRTLNRTTSHRKALLMNLANALFEHERITTTEAKASELKRVAERLITLAKRKDLHSIRLAFSILRNKDMVRKLFGDISERFGATNGGYTRVLKVGRRKGDSAPMALIELTLKGEKETKKEKEKAAKAKAKKKEKKPAA